MKSKCERFYTFLSWHDNAGYLEHLFYAQTNCPYFVQHILAKGL